MGLTAKSHAKLLKAKQHNMFFVERMPTKRKCKKSSAEDKWFRSMKTSYKKKKYTAYTFASDVIHLVDDKRAMSNYLKCKGYTQPTLEGKLKALYGR